MEGGGLLPVVGERVDKGKGSMGGGEVKGKKGLEGLGWGEYIFLIWFLALKFLSITFVVFFFFETSLTVGHGG